MHTSYSSSMHSTHVKYEYSLASIHTLEYAYYDSYAYYSMHSTTRE